MRDKALVIETLEQVEQVIGNLLESTAELSDINELPKSPDGMLRLNAEKRHSTTSCGH